MIEIRVDAADIPEGEGKRIDAEGRAPIALFNVGGTFYAIDDTCTHGEASLCEGELDGCIVECPFHAGTFDITTGEAVGYPAFIPVQTYVVTVDGGSVVIKLP